MTDLEKVEGLKNSLVYLYKGENPSIYVGVLALVLLLYPLAMDAIENKPPASLKDALELLLLALKTSATELHYGFKLLEKTEDLTHDLTGAFKCIEKENTTIN